MHLNIETITKVSLNLHNTMNQGLSYFWTGGSPPPHQKNKIKQSFSNWVQ